ncbi:hypothetical protein HUU05_15395 [candidate division KSB1 bacterium]|nr:hypothetical protein [candidate division KSB1 bacterium]
MKKQVVAFVGFLLFCAVSLSADCPTTVAVTLPASQTVMRNFCPESSEIYHFNFVGNNSGQFVMYFDDPTTSTRVDYINVSNVTSWSKSYNLLANHQYEVNLWSSAGGYFLAEPQ